MMGRLGPLYKPFRLNRAIRHPAWRDPLPIGRQGFNVYPNPNLHGADVEKFTEYRGSKRTFAQCESKI